MQESTLLPALRRACVRVARGKAMFALIVGALGLTLGAAFCAFAFTQLVITRPLPYPGQDRLFVARQVILDQDQSVQDRALSFPAAALLHEQGGEVFETATIIDYARDVIVSHPAQPLVTLSYATPAFADLFDPPMAKGIFPGARPDDAGERPVAVISYSAWQTLFDRRDDVLGRTVRTALGVDFEVVGVTAPGFIEPGFNGPGHRTSVWLPWKFDPAIAHWGWAATTEGLVVAGRLAPGISGQQAANRLSVILDARWRSELGAASGARVGWSTRVDLVGAQRAIAGNAASVGPLLLAGTLGLVLVTLLNVFHVLVARVAERAREFSIQMALGASRRHIFNALFADMLVLMSATGVVALLFTAGGFTLMQHYLGSTLPRVDELALDARVVAIAIGTSIALAVVLAAVATAPVGRLAAGAALNAGRHGTAPRMSRQLGTFLMTAQVAVAGLLVAANGGLFREAFAVLQAHGINLERSSNVFLYQSAPAPLDDAALKAQLGEIRRRLAELPEVERVSQSHSPLQDFIKSSVVSTRSGSQYPVELKRIDQEYFDLTAQALAAGRGFDASDIRQSAAVAIVNSAFAKSLEREGGALGAALTRAGESPRTVVGIVDEQAYPDQPSGTPRIYFPASEAGASFIVAFKPGAQLSRQELVAFVARVNPNFGVFLYDDLDQQRAELLQPRRMATTSTLVIALLVMLVSGLGLYGMLRYSVRVIRAEIGARLAFGARPRHIHAMLVGRNLRAFTCGSIAGAAIALLVLPRVHAGLLHLQWLDAVAATIAIALLLLLACWLSARPLLAQPPAVALQDATR